MKKVFSLVLIITVFIWLTGCDSDSQEPTPEAEYSVLHAGNNLVDGNYTSKMTKILTTQEDYEAELVRYSADLPESIDFDRYVVLVADMGERPTGGYGVEVTSIEEYFLYVKANIRLTVPNPDCGVVIPALTNPYVFVQVDTQKELIINEKLWMPLCE